MFSLPQFLVIAYLILLSPPPEFINDRSKAVVLLWFSVAVFWRQSFCDV